MRINAHLASAILPADKIKPKCFYSSGMKKRQINMEIIAEQKRAINAICVEYGVKTTEIAITSSIAPSTLNRFMNNDPPANTLSSITMRAIKEAWPLNGDQEDRQKEALGAGEMALVYVAKEIISMLLNRKRPTKKNFIDDLGYALEHYRKENLSTAILVIGDLLDHVKNEPHQEEQQAIHRLLSLSPPKSA